MNLNEFESLLKSSSGPHLIYFWAPWCVPCRGMSPQIQETAAQFAGQVELLKTNADDSPDLLRALNVWSIPTLMAYTNGKLLFRRTGTQSPAALREIFAAAAASRTPAPALTPLQRVLRAVSGGVLAVLGMSQTGGPNVFLLLVGGILLFSAVYDRCPIYRAISGRIKEWFQRLRQTAASSR